MVSSATTTIILVSLTLFQVGLIIGLLLSDRTDITTKANMRTAVAIVVTIAWVTATAAGILLQSYTVSPLLHAIMGAVVGYFFTDQGLNLNIGGSKK